MGTRAKGYGLSGSLKRLAKVFRQPRLDRVDRTLVVTGIPRSGTSLFCSLLNQQEGIICLNEIYYDVWTLPYHLRRIRVRLETGGGIPNKLDESGRLATDTMDGASVRRITVPPQSPDVVIGTNVNTPYLLRLERLVRLDCPIVVLVRDPTYTIASWGSSRTERIPEAKVGPPESDRHRRWDRFEFVGTTPEERRAEVWNHLAGIILDHKEFLQILRYEDLVSAPSQEIGRVLERFGLRPSQGLGSLENRNISSRFEALDNAEKAVEKHAPLSKAFGYGPL